MAFRVEKYIGRFEISMDELPRMHVLQRFENLVHDVLSMDFLQDACSDHDVQICVSPTVPVSMKSNTR